MSAIHQAETIAEHFLDARRAARGLTIYPGLPPTTLAEGYAVQAAALARSGDPIAGWKVGRILAPLDDQYGCDRLAGPIFAPSVAPANDDAIGHVFADGFGAVEAEYLFRLAAAPGPGQTRLSLDDAAALIDAVHIGIEIASSPFAGINAMGPAVTVSDFGNNNGLLIGPAVLDWRDGGYALQPVVTRIDGMAVGEGVAAAFAHGAIGSVRFLLDNLIARGFAIQPGWWISTGAITGVHQVRPGQHVEADFGPLGTLRCRIEAQAAQ